VTVVLIGLEQIPRRTLTLVVKASSDEAALVPAFRQQLARMDGGLPLSDVRTMEAVVDEFLWMPKLTAQLFAVSS
jgi:hypothetical protein